MKETPSLQNNNYNSYYLLSFMFHVDVYTYYLIKSS